MNPIFNKEKVGYAKHPLVRLLRLILYRKNITFDDFTRCHNRYAKIYGVSPKDANSDKGNHLKTMQKVTGITFQKMHHILVSIFRLEIIRFSITIRDPNTNEVITYNSDDDI